MSIATIIVILLVFIALTLLYLSSLLNKVFAQYLELKLYLETQIDVTPLVDSQKNDIKALSNRVEGLNERFGELGELLLQILNQGKLARESTHLLDTRLSELSPVVMNTALALKSFDKLLHEKLLNEDQSI